MKTIREMRIWGREELQGLRKLPEPSLVSEETIAIEVDMLLKEILGMTDSEFIASQKTVITADQKGRFAKNISRRKQSEPIAYILGKKDFYKHTFVVSPAVLIPRPETELIVERALKLFNSKPESFYLCDLCTGSGAIILSIIAELRERYGEEYLKQGEIIASDISPEALEIARRNAKELNLLSFLTIVQSDLMGQVSININKKIVVFVSNPPYVENSSILPKDVGEFEPTLALRAGADGLDVIRRIIFSLAHNLKKGAFLIMEIGENQGDGVVSILQQSGLSAFKFYNDLSNKLRVVEVGVT